VQEKGATAVADIICLVGASGKRSVKRRTRGVTAPVEDRNCRGPGKRCGLAGEKSRTLVGSIRTVENAGKNYLQGF